MALKWWICIYHRLSTSLVIYGGDELSVRKPPIFHWHLQYLNALNWNWTEVAFVIKIHSKRSLALRPSCDCKLHHRGGGFKSQQGKEFKKIEFEFEWKTFNPPILYRHLQHLKALNWNGSEVAFVIKIHSKCSLALRPSCDCKRHHRGRGFKSRQGKGFKKMEFEFEWLTFFRIFTRTLCTFYSTN